MILVLGNDPHKVDLPDLGDVVYFKQQKFFSDAQRVRSKDLDRAIKAGKLVVLQSYGNVDQEFNISPPVKATPPRSDVKLDLLLEKLSSLESAVSSSKPSSQTDNAVVDALLDRIAKLEERIAGLSGASGTDSSLVEAVRQLAERVESTTKDTSILDRLECILERAGSSDQAAKESTRPEDVYVPTVTVEDANSHIKLDVRAIDTPASDLDASLAALKKLKENK